MTALRRLGSALGQFGRHEPARSSFAAFMTSRSVQSGGPDGRTGVLAFVGLLITGLVDLARPRALAELSAIGRHGKPSRFCLVAHPGVAHA